GAGDLISRVPARTSRPRRSAAGGTTCPGRSGSTACRRCREAGRARMSCCAQLSSRERDTPTLRPDWPAAQGQSDPNSMGQTARRRPAHKHYPERSGVSAHPGGLHILVRVLPVYLAAAALILFVAGVLRDPRSFSNAVLLGSGLALAALAAAH